MPTYPKQVRFAYKLNILHSPHTPALTFASSSPSSAGPITPISASYSLPGPYPHTAPYVPSFSGKPVHPHPLLQASAVSWDLMDSPPTITRNHHSLSRQSLHEQATTPPLPFLSITSIHLPWIIKVYASNGSFVTLGDVLDSIYCSLRTNVANTEFNSLPHQNDQRRATRAYEQRYRRLRHTSARDQEKRGGMKRIDFLMGYTKFKGISNTGHRPDEWRLNITS